MVEQVLVVPADKVTLKFENGWAACKDTSNYLKELLAHGFFMNRPDAEINPEFKQLIPYCIIKKLGKAYNEYLIYQRSKKGGEKRLHSLYSLGIGGHIGSTDNPNNIYESALLREVEEEIGLKRNEYWGEDIGFIYDNSNEVGKVHMGICHILTMFNIDKEIKPESTLANWAFEKPEVIKRNVDSFENWSQILIQNNVLV